MPGGNIDFFLVALRDGQIMDYLGVEIQGLDTTGSGGIWEAREDLRRGAMGNSYRYGINWRMSAKTILIQMHHKARAFEDLGKKLVLAIQEQFYDYVTREFETGHLRPTVDADTVRFHAYDLVEINGQYRLRITRKASTNALGIEKMLGIGREPTVSPEVVLQRIQAKLPQAIALST